MKSVTPGFLYIKSVVHINSPMYKQVVHLHDNLINNHVSAITDVDLEPIEPGVVGDLDDLDLYVFIKDQ